MKWSKTTHLHTKFVLLSIFVRKSKTITFCLLIWIFRFILTFERFPIIIIQIFRLMVEKINKNERKSLSEIVTEKQGKESEAFWRALQMEPPKEALLIKVCFEKQVYILIEKKKWLTICIYI